MTIVSRLIWVLWLNAALLPAWGAAPSREEKAAIPPDLFFEFKPVPAEENAIINWRRAFQTKPSLDDALREALRFAWTPGQRRPAAEQIDELRAWLRRNRESLDQFEVSLRQPKAQWPERDAWKEQPEMFGLNLFIRARLFEADELAEKGDFTNAVKSLRGSLQLAQRGIDADAALIHYLICGHTRTLVHGAIQRLAARRQAPLALLEELLAGLPALDSETNSYARMLRVEFTCYAYPALDVRKLTEAWSSISETNAVLSLYPEEFRRPFKILLDPLLVSQHPKPLDEIAEVQRAASHYRISLTNAFSAWTNRSDAVVAETGALMAKLLTDIEPLMELTEDEPLPLSRQAAQKARRLYLEVQNPVGRILQCGFGSLMASDVRVFIARTDREATRALLGLLIFERKKGMLPGSLKALVDEKILPALPFDFFASTPLAYSRERRLVWSAGEDATDDNGSASPDSRWTGDDAVWTIPELDPKP